VRSTNASIATVLRQAREQSATFRRLVETRAEPPVLTGLLSINGEVAI